MAQVMSYICNFSECARFRASNQKFFCNFTDESHPIRLFYNYPKFSTLVSKELYTDIDRWTTYLNKMIEARLALGKDVAVIALSRKMPRLLECMRMCIDSQSVQTLFAHLGSSRVHLMTEYGILPFAAKREESQLRKVEGIIIDDAIIRGTTVNRVGVEWFAVTGEFPKIHPIYRLGWERIIKFLQDSEISASKTSYDEFNSREEEISSLIERIALPLDMEYPLIYLNCPYEDIKRHILNRIPANWARYTVGDGEARESFSVVLEDEKLGLYTNDFAKVRLFKSRTGEGILEVIAPQSFEMQDFLSSPMFQHPIYSLLCAVVVQTLASVKQVMMEDLRLKEVAKSISVQRNAKTIVVWVNYLLSLACMVRNYDKFIPKDALPDIKKSDVAMIIGDDLSNEWTSTMNDILWDKLKSDRKASLVAVPSIYRFPQTQDAHQLAVTAAMQPDYKVMENLDAIMGVSHYSQPLAKLAGENTLFSHSQYGETIDSLRRLLMRFHNPGPDLDREIHRWLDARIDSGCIVPRYEFVKGSDGKTYARRFFMTGTDLPKAQ